MTAITDTMVNRSTWLGVPARQTIHLLGRGVLGLRVVEFRNDDTPDSVEVRLIEGDGRDNTLRIWAHYADKTQEEATSIVEVLTRNLELPCKKSK